MLFKNLFAGTAVIALLSACGGGGGVASTPTPTPTPAPSNTKLTNLKASQSFTNNAASLAGTWDLTTGTAISGSAKAAPLTVSYDAKTNGYTVSTGNQTQTFLPKDITSSDNGETIYAVPGASGSDHLTLISTTLDSSLALQYVGMGYWQRNAVADTKQTVDFSVFDYGLPTSAAAVPRTGSAAYAIDTFGLVTAPGEDPTAFQGGGQLDVDFAQGIFNTHSYLTEHALVSGGSTTGGGLELTAAGNLSSHDATFSGSAFYEGSFGSAAGALAGSFFGPSGSEVGATFSGENANGLAVVGSFVGQQDPNLVVGNHTLTNLTQEQLFYTRTYGNSVGQLNWKNSETFTYSPPSSDQAGGLFTLADKVSSPDANFTKYAKTFGSAYYGTENVTLSMFKPGADNTKLALTYASLATGPARSRVPTAPPARSWWTNGSRMASRPLRA